jgi:Methylamine utilisation protein MauE
MAPFAQAFLVVVLVAASAAKLAGPDRFLRTLTSLPWLSLPAARALTRLVPVAEIGVAALLVAVPPAGAIAALILLTVFTGVVAVELAAGRRFACGCFGGTESRPAGPVTLLRNVLLLAAAVAIVALPRDAEPGAVLAGAGAGLLFLVLEVGSETLWAVRRP